MTLLTASILLFQAIFMYRVGGSWLFPPALYALYWAGVLVCSVVIRFGDYSMTVDALMVFLVGSMVFSIGGYAAMRCVGWGIPREPIFPKRKHFIQSCIIAYSVGLLAFFPLFFSTLKSVGETLGIEELALAARVAFGESDRGGIPRYFLSLTSVGGIMAYCAAWLYDGQRRDKFVLGLAVFAPLMMNVLTFARTPVYMLLTGVLAILMFRKSIRKRTVVMYAILGISLGILMGSVLGKGPEFDAGKSFPHAIVEKVAVYIVGGPVGFGYVKEIPTSVGDPGLSLRFFTQAASSFGMDIKLPHNVLGEFSDILGNVYTIYFAYWLDWGWWGVVVISIIMGYLCTAVYGFARMGNPVAGVAFGLVTGAMLNSAIGDGIFGSSVPWLLILTVVGFFWNVPVFSFRFSKLPFQEA
jgi:oligosaccharide repeat unit polymerase